MGIADTDITVDMRNKQVTFQNINIRLYNRQIKKINIIHLEIANSVANISLNQLANEKNPEPQKLC